MPIATIQMKNSAIESTSEIFSADQVSMCRSCSRARRGPRPAALPGRRADVTAGASVAAAVVEDPRKEPDPVAGGTGGAPGGPPVGLTAADAPVPGAWTFWAPVAGAWAFCDPVGIAWVADTGGAGSPGAVPSG